jgi:dienelactone hydrolase
MPQHGLCRRFIIAAPDSHAERYWFAPNASDPFTSDWYHIHACYRWVRRRPGVVVDPQRLAYAGFSRGGYSAAALASRVGAATHALVFHSAILAEMMGRRTVPIWVSSGLEDSLFKPSRLQPRIDLFRSLAPQFNVTLKFFEGGHGLSDPAERSGLVEWWYGTPPAAAAQAGFRDVASESFPVNQTVLGSGTGAGAAVAAQNSPPSGVNISVGDTSSLIVT